MNAEFAGLRAIVTGGASGIGLATATMLADRGARVACLDLVAEVPEPLLAVRCDVADDDSVRRAVADVIAAFGGLDILVNNAGIGAQGTVADNPDTEWRRSFEINVMGIVRMSRAALDALRASEHAAIVNTCSIAATAGLPQRACYSATKGAVQSLTLAMAADHIREGIRVNCVNPGTADTPWVGRLLDQADDPAAERAALNARQPMGRMVTADEVAAAICYLASPLAASTTGIALAVDGGMQGLRLRPLPPPDRVTVPAPPTPTTLPPTQHQRLALHTRLRPEMVATYEAVHRVIPPDLDAALRDAGVVSWRIWRDGVDLFHEVECDDVGRMWTHLDRHPANVPWQEQIGPLLDLDVDYSTGDDALRLVWELPADRAEPADGP
jgi:2-keto-3-deoxy-L-fuconate dehydrogenase